uniref:Beta-catenin-like protein 1 N-terminal domain-containing protein n=1 Tax=Lotharella oceanica TaxID=641309 RepID=A0A7S2U0P3_9EUKA
MDSEIKVHQIIQDLQGVAAAPDLFPEFVRLKAVSPLLSLISHENTDISIEVVDLLKEFTDVETVQEEGRNAEILLDALIAKQMIPLLVTNLERLDETQKEDQQAVHNTLNIFENLMEVAPEVAAVKLSTETKLMDWLLKRLRKGVFDENQLYASEILSMLLLTGGKAVKAFTEKQGLKRLVRCVAAYRKRDPESLDEVEFVENLFNCIVSTLGAEKANQLAFAQADGLQLMITMVRKKRYTQAAALKVLNYAVSDCMSNCEKTIECSGLKAIFKAFMARGKVSKRLKQEIEATEEHVLSCIVQLFVHLSDVRYLRLLNKFRENGYEKVERLVELHDKYYSRLEDAERKYQREHPDEPVDEDELYMRRLDNGLYSLQMCALLIALICSAGEKGIYERVVQLLNQQDSSLKDVKETLEEYHANLAGDKSGKKMKTILNNVIIILDQLLGTGEEEGGGEEEDQASGSAPAAARGAPQEEKEQ